MERGGYRGRGRGNDRNWNNGGRHGGRGGGGGGGGGQSHQYYDGHNQQQCRPQQQQQQQPFRSDRYSGERYTGDQWTTSTHGRQGNFAHHSAEDYDPQPYWREQTQRRDATRGRGRARETPEVDGYGRNYGPRDDGGNVWSNTGGYSNSRNNAGGNVGSRSSDGYGSGSRGTVRSEAAATQAQLEFRLPPPPPGDNSLSGSSDPVVRDVSSAENFLKSVTKHIPVKRPDEGGKCFIKMARLRVNHFPVDFRHDTVIRHYDIDVKPVGTNGGFSKVSKSDLSMVRNKLCAENPEDFPLSMTAYDGEKNIFTAVPLPSGTFKVEFTEGEDVRHRNYVVTIKHVSDLKLCKLKEYLRGGLTSIPRDILQGMDVVMKENPTRNMIQVGRTFHPVEPDPEDDLRFGITASRGIQHSLKPTFQGLALCLDYSVLAFRKKMPVIDFLRESIPGFSLQHFKDFRRAAVENTLKNLKVNVMHRVTKQKYTIVGLTRENTRHVKFDVEDSNGNKMQLLLVDYFTEKYGRNINYMDIPALDFSKNNRKNYVPMEFCVLAEGQIYPKENLDHNVARLLKNMSLADPKERESRICDMVRAEHGPCGGGIIRNFGLQVNKNMTSVNGRVLGPPELKLGLPKGGIKRIVVEGEKCQWNMVGKAVVEGKAIQRWALLDFTASERPFFRLDQDSFTKSLKDKCEKLGMHMERILLQKPARMQVLSNVSMLRKLLEDTVDHCNQLGRGRLQLLLCAMSDKHEGYKYIKWISETGIGVVTQCFLSKEANKTRGLDQYLTNLALKINAKVGGSNVELIERLPLFKGEGHVMCIGADVNHPGSRNKSSPSIAAVVASVNWPAMTRYAARVRPQDHRKEEILHFGQMCKELVEIYERHTKVKPEKILIFRDGVSEGQFDMVLNKELTDLKIVFEAMSYHPTITLIVAQKRHQTRFFHDRDRGHTTNVPPGTVVDTIVVHPREFDFYLCSHYGSLGTSKPTHYHVLYDEHFFSSDQLQQLIYSMCFTFARCTKPVSLVPPVYYADLVAYRGRAYHDAMTLGHSPSSMSSGSSTSSCASFDEKFYQLHSDLDDVMYFV